MDIYEAELVGVRGFEPPTPASRTQYSTRLSYTPIPLNDFAMRSFQAIFWSLETRLLAKTNSMVTFDREVGQF